MKKYYVSIYCKIYAESYPEFYGYKTADEIYEHLTQDLGCCYEEGADMILKPKPIPGDKAIWYLGCNEKFGSISIETATKSFISNWSHGESSFDNVSRMIAFMSRNRILPYNRCMKLIQLVWEGRRIDDMYQIPNYLLCKRDNKKWVRQESDFRGAIQELVKEVKETLCK